MDKETAFNEWIEKTEWVQRTTTAAELGLHRADVLRLRIEALQREVDELKTKQQTARRYRFVNAGRGSMMEADPDGEWVRYADVCESDHIEVVQLAKLLGMKALPVLREFAAHGRQVTLHERVPMDEAQLIAAALRAAAADALTYKNQPGNVEAWRLGEAARHAKRGGDPIDHGLSLLDQLQQRGFVVAHLDAAMGAKEPTP